MSDHPEFPQESPAIKYIVDQVSKVEEATNCSVGYYKSLAKIISRLDKTDIELNRLHQTISVLKEITDSDVIASCIGKKSDEMQTTIRSGLNSICEGTVAAVSDHLGQMQADNNIMLEKIKSTDDRSIKIQVRLNEQMKETIKRLDDHIRDAETRILPALWKLWLYAFLTLAVGVAIGKWLI